MANLNIARNYRLISNGNQIDAPRQSDVQDEIVRHLDTFAAARLALPESKADRPIEIPIVREPQTYPIKLLGSKLLEKHYADVAHALSRVARFAIKDYSMAISGKINTPPEETFQRCVLIDDRRKTQSRDVGTMDAYMWLIGPSIPNSPDHQNKVFANRLAKDGTKAFDIVRIPADKALPVTVKNTNINDIEIVQPSVHNLLLDTGYSGVQKFIIEDGVARPVSRIDKNDHDKKLSLEQTLISRLAWNPRVAEDPKPNPHTDKEFSHMILRQSNHTRLLIGNQAVFGYNAFNNDVLGPLLGSLVTGGQRALPPPSETFAIQEMLIETPVQEREKIVIDLSAPDAEAKVRKLLAALEHVTPEENPEQTTAFRNTSS